jgi:hypothetical protein
VAVSVAGGDVVCVPEPVAAVAVAGESIVGAVSRTAGASVSTVAGMDADGIGLIVSAAGGGAAVSFTALFGAELSDTESPDVTAIPSASGAVVAAGSVCASSAAFVTAATAIPMGPAVMIVIAWARIISTER